MTDSRERWTVHHFSQSNPDGEGQDDLTITVYFHREPRRGTEA